MGITLTGCGTRVGIPLTNNAKPIFYNIHVEEGGGGGVLAIIILLYSVLFGVRMSNTLSTLE